VLPNEREVYRLVRPVVLRYSEANPGAQLVAEELAQHIERLSVLEWNAPRLPKEATQLLLCLNVSTFTSDGREVLADIVRTALSERLPIVMVHQTDPCEGGCNFKNFFETTPQDLIDAQLFGPVAIAWEPRPYRKVSIRLTAQALGSLHQGFMSAARPKRLQTTEGREPATRSRFKMLLGARAAMRLGRRSIRRSAMQHDTNVELGTPLDVSASQTRHGGSIESPRARTVSQIRRSHGEEPCEEPSSDASVNAIYLSARTQ